VMWNFWWTKWHLGRFSPSISVSLANSHSTDSSTVTIVYHREWYNRPNSGCSTKWTQSHPMRKQMREDGKLHCYSCENLKSKSASLVDKYIFSLD
jgi:hypothetical protein